MKFGGTSLEDGDAFQRVAHIIGQNPRANLVVVVSAMSGVTDALISSFQRAAKGETSEALQTLERHFQRHLQVAKSLGSNAGRMQAIVDHSRREILELLGEVRSNRRTTAEGQDAMASHGERLSANLLTIVLEGCGIPASYVDARCCIVTDNQHGNAEPLTKESRAGTRKELQPLLGAKKVPILGGFIGATRNGVTTTLGRGSSDYSATLLSAALGARETQIWTDVDGVMTADPALVQSASTVSQLSYEEGAELARLGASVLYAKMIRPVFRQKIPIRILNSRAPQRTGTLICAGANTRNGTVKAIAHKTNLTRIDITSTPAFVANGFLGSIKDVFNNHRVQMEIVGTSEVGVSLACEQAVGLRPVIQGLRQVGSVKTKGRRAIISCVGEGLQRVDRFGKLRTILGEIDPKLTWQRTSSLSLVSVVDADLAGPILRQIHQRIFECKSTSKVHALN
jgi:aspartate kinase